MDLTLTKRADYVMRAAISLARHTGDGSYRKIREVSEEMELPVRYTPHILNLLLRSGVAEARAGQHGGYRLKRPANDVSLLELVEAAEGPLRSERCSLNGGPCHWETMCALHPIWDAAQSALMDVLRARTLASVAEIDRRLESQNFPIPDNSHRLNQRSGGSAKA